MTVIKVCIGIIRDRGEKKRQNVQKEASLFPAQLLTFTVEMERQRRLETSAVFLRLPEVKKGSQGLFFCCFDLRLLFLFLKRIKITFTRHLTFH